MLQQLLGKTGFAIVLILGSGHLLMAQVTTGSISGTVKDESGAVVPGATVTVTQKDTGTSRSMVSDQEGRYTLPDLALGSYEVKGETPGFETIIRSGIQLTIGRQALVDLTMKVGEVSQRVVVEGEAPLVETTTSTVTGLVDDQKVRELPLNGRGFTQLALLQPGVMTTGGTASGAQPGNEGQKLSISGTRTTQSGYLIDGTDVRNQWGGTPGSASGYTLGVETIREFTVVTSTASAEYGGFAGGVVNAVSRSGTNQFHGSLFEFLRNSKMDAHDFFYRKLTATDPRIAPYKRNQFGFAAGGPIKKDKTFFFGSYEGFRDRLTNTSQTTVPDFGARTGDLGTNGTVTIATSVVPYLNGYPLPNTLQNKPGVADPYSNGDGTAQYTGSNFQPTNEDYYALRVDQQLTNADSLFVRYTADRGDRATQDQVPALVEKVNNLNQYVTLDEKKILSTKLLNDFLFSFNRTHFYGSVLGNFDPSLKFIPTEDRTLGTISVSGLGGWGPSPNTPRKDGLNRFQSGDTVIYATGRHTIKAGAQFIRSQLNTLNTFRVEGGYSFTSLKNFLTGTSSQFQGTITPLIHSGIRENMYGFFVQDDFKLRPNLTTNVGLRYEPTGDISEVAGRISNLDNLTDTSLRAGNPWFSKNPAWKNFGPRVGLAWDPFKDGKSSVRAGFGVFYDIFGPSTYQGAAQYNPPFFIQASQANPVFPNFYQTVNIQTLPNGGFSFSNGVTPGLWVIPKAVSNQPYVMQYSLTIQRQITSSTVVSAAYVGSRGVHLSFMEDANLAAAQFVNGRWTFPVAQRQYSAFGQLRVFDFDGNSHYNSFQLQANRRLQRGFQIQGSYSYSRSTDDSSNNTAVDSASSGNGVSDSYFDRHLDHGLSSFDVRHLMSINGSYDLPFGTGKKFVTGGRVLQKVVGGWQTIGILSARTGIPVNILAGFDRSGSQAGTDISGRADLAPGASNNPVLGYADLNHYYDVSAFSLQPAGTVGNLGRDTVIGPGSVDFDFGLIKQTPIGEGKMVQFRAESFNTLNRANFGQPNQSLFTSSGPSANAGKITTTSTRARQLQFALKIIF